jgi:hypothetical protein
MPYRQFYGCFNGNEAGFERTWLKVRAMLAAEFIVKRRRPILSGLGLLLDRELRSAMVGVYTNFKTLL